MPTSEQRVKLEKALHNFETHGKQYFKRKFQEQLQTQFKLQQEASLEPSKSGDNQAFIHKSAYNSSMNETVKDQLDTTEIHDQLAKGLSNFVNTIQTKVI